MLCGARTTSIDTNLLMKIIIKLQQCVIVFMRDFFYLVFSRSSRCIDGYEIMGLRQNAHYKYVYMYILKYEAESIS